MATSFQRQKDCMEMCGQAFCCRCLRLWNNVFTSSRTSASLLRMSSCRPWNVGTLPEKENTWVLDRKLINSYILNMPEILCGFFSKERGRCLASGSICIVTVKILRVCLISCRVIKLNITLYVYVPISLLMVISKRKKRNQFDEDI